MPSSVQVVNRVQLGWGQHGRLTNLKGERKLYEIEGSGLLGSIPGINITSANGSFMGQLRSDVAKPILRTLKFTLDENGCSDFEMVLNQMPRFTIPPFATIDLMISGASAKWYRGELASHDADTVQNDGYKFKGFGWRKKMEALSPDQVYTAPQDIGLIVDDITQNFIQPNTGIKYNPSKIDTSTGVLIASNLDLSKAKLKKIMDTLSKMAGCYWGVDSDGDLYFKPKTNAIKRTFLVGYDVQEFQPKLNVDDVKNSIFVKRQKGRSGGGAGWVVETIKNDTASQSKYGIKQLDQQVPGNFSTAECNLLGDALLSELKEPRFSAEGKTILVYSDREKFEPGLYRFVMPLMEYDVRVQECDDKTDWTKQGVGDLVINDETAIMESGAGSIRLNYTTAANDRAEVPVTFEGFAKKIRMYARSSAIGQLITLGIGETVWNDIAEKSVQFNIANQFYLFEWDVSTLNIEKIGMVGIRIDDNSGVARQVWIDSIDVVNNGCRHFDLEFKKAKYTFSGGDHSCEAEFGPVPPKMESYIAALFSETAEMKFTGESR